MLNELNQSNTKLKKQFQLRFKAIQHTKVYKFYYIISFLFHNTSILFLADYRKWQASKTEPIRHDGGYVSLFYIILYFSSFCFLSKRLHRQIHLKVKVLIQQII